MVMSTVTQRATLDDLARTAGKAELIGGKVVVLMPSGDLPTDVAANIYVSLRVHARATRQGVAKTDGIGYVVPELPSGRESFSPDASYYIGQRPTNRMRFIEGPPTFAVEVRSENDYGPSAEAELLAKRIDYFIAGTGVVWDVDPRAETVAIYRGNAHVPVAVLHRGDIADAEPAVPGWRIPVDEVFA
jgi:Uma2 family endonuclease